MKKQLVWSSDVDVEDFQSAYREYIEDNCLDEDPENYDSLWEFAHETNDDSLCIERMMLDVVLPRPIVVIADLGLWNGRRSAYKLIKSGNIKDCLYTNDDDIEWFVDNRKNFRGIENHHDGTNYYLYRVFKENISDEQMDNFLDKVYNGTFTSADVSRYTESVGKHILNVYGYGF